MKKIFLAIMLMMAFFNVHAFSGCEKQAVGVHLGTYHFERNGQREFNPGVYVNCDGVTAGLYVNSHSKPTWYAGRTFEHGIFALTVGVGTGYQTGEQKQSLSPLVLVSVKLPAGFRLGAFPSHGKKSGGLHLTKEF